MSDKPDAEQYARIILWHLCTLQAQINLMQSDLICRAGRDDGATDMEILDETSKRGKIKLVFFRLHIIRPQSICP